MAKVKQPPVVVTGGVIEGQPILGPAAATIHSMPDRNTVRAQLLGAMDVTGVRVTSDIVRGPTHHTIIEYAAESKTDLIVMGTHGRSRLERTFFGSVTERVMKSVTCPVLVAKVSGSA